MKNVSPYLQGIVCCGLKVHASFALGFPEKT
jgi:hypothetical protein